MARFCTACGRPLDAEHHDIGEEKRVIPDRKHGFRYAKNYGCKVRLIGNSPVDGRVLIPTTPQRIKAIDTRYVHESRFELDLKP